MVFDVEAGDYDRDGHTDALLALEWSDAPANSRFRGVELYRGNGHGGFAFAWGVGVDGLRALRVDDVDRDGRLDLVALAAGSSGPRISVLRQAGGVPVETPVSGPVGDLQLADVNRDGKVDALVAHFAPGTIGVYLVMAPGTSHRAAPSLFRSGPARSSSRISTTTAVPTSSSGPAGTRSSCCRRPAAGRRP